MEALVVVRADGSRSPGQLEVLAAGQQIRARGRLTALLFADTPLARASSAMG